MKVDIRLSQETIAWLRSIEKAAGVPLDNVVAVVLVIGQQLLKVPKLPVAPGGGPSPSTTRAKRSRAGERPA